jgi:hypothetical protein
MVIRIRNINGVTIAICAARSVEKEGDIYLDDTIHTALSDKFAEDFNSMYYHGIPTSNTDLRDAEESGNSGSDWWDKKYKSHMSEKGK